MLVRAVLQTFSVYALEQLLHKLFHQDSIRLFEPAAVHFECTCNYDKMLNAASMLSKEEIAELLSTQKNIVVTCEFCNDHYSFTQADLS